MAGREDRFRFALDHNFPAPVLGAFDLMMPNVEFVAIANIDDEFAWPMSRVELTRIVLDWTESSCWTQSRRD